MVVPHQRAGGRPVLGQQALKLRQRDHGGRRASVGGLPIAKLAGGGLIRLKAGRHHDGTNCQIEFDRPILQANAAWRGEFKAFPAARTMLPINHRTGREAAGIRLVDGLALAQAFVEFIRGLNRASFNSRFQCRYLAGYPTRLLADVKAKIAHVALGCHNLSAGMDGDVGLVEHCFDQFVQQAAGVFTGREERIQPGHTATQKMGFFHQGAFVAGQGVLVGG